jgi:hypothetical protein
MENSDCATSYHSLGVPPAFAISLGETVLIYISKINSINKLKQIIPAII